MGVTSYDRESGWVFINFLSVITLRIQLMSKNLYNSLLYEFSIISYVTTEISNVSHIQHIISK